MNLTNSVRINLQKFKLKFIHQMRVHFRSTG